MTRKMLVCAVAVAIAAGLSPARASAADNLAVHEKEMILGLVTRRSPCADCDAGPDARTASFRFASSYTKPWANANFAYTVVSYLTFGKTRVSWLVGYDTNGWRLLAKSADGRPTFRCGKAVLLNPYLWKDTQMKLVRRIATCHS